MHYCTFVALFAIICMVGIEGASRKTPASINKDAIKLAQLAEKIWSLKPAILKQGRPLIYCEVMNKCCEEEDRSKAISFLDASNDLDFDGFENVMKQCMNTTTSNKGNQLCTAVIESIVPPWIIYRNANMGTYMGTMNRYIDIIDKYVKNLDKSDEWALVCNGEEMHALLCLSNTKLVESCVGKMLQQLFDSDYKNYEKTIKDMKQILTKANQDLVTALVEDTSTD